MLKHLPTNLPQYVLHAFATMSPQHHVVEDYVSTAPILIDVANITGHQCVRCRSGAIAVLYETHWNKNPCAAWERNFTFKPSPTISSRTGRISKPTVSRSTENINDCVLTQPGKRSPAPNVKSTFRNLIHSSLALATVLASYPLLYKLKPPVYIIHFMVSGGLVKTNNHPMSWDATSYGPSTIQAPSPSTPKHLPKIWLSTPSGAPGASKHPATPIRFEVSYMENHLAFHFPLSPCIIMTLPYVRPTLLCISSPRTMISTTSTAISSPKAT